MKQMLYRMDNGCQEKKWQKKQRRKGDSSRFFVNHSGSVPCSFARTTKLQRSDAAETCSLEIPSMRAFESPVGIPANALSMQVTRPKGELISQKRAASTPPIFLSFPTASPSPSFRCKISFDKQKQPSYTSTHRKQYLIKQRQFRSQGYGQARGIGPDRRP
jgi:hypothetical protein